MVEVQIKAEPQIDTKELTPHVSLDTVEGILIVDGRPQVEHTDSTMSLSFNSNEDFLRFIEKIREGSV